MKKVTSMVLALAALACTAAAPQKKPIRVAPATPDAVTHHVAHIDGQTIPYTARAGTLTLFNDKHQPTARMFYVAYSKDGANLNKRPVTFFYNGGPGSSTIWLHMGSFAPMRVAVANGAPTKNAPFHLIDNQYSLLNKTDLVFIDAPNTGYSRVIGYGKPKDFMGVDQDGRAFTQFIERYISAFNRWNSPKFLFGESYGTTRDAVLSSMLQNAGVQLNGIVFQSSILNFGLAELGGGNPIADGDWAYVFWMPSEAAAAWYHHALPNRPANLDVFVQQVKQFAGGQYLHDLAMGDTLSSAQREDVVRKMHAYLGLSEQYIRNANLRVSYPRFEKELLRTHDVVIGRYDSRYETFALDAPGNYPDWDPSDVGIDGAFIGTFNAYIRNELHYRTSLTYRPTAYGGELGARWDMHHNGDDPPANVAPDIARAMSENPHLHVFSANGYYDFATPFFATEYTFDHLNIAPALQKNIQFGFYHSGHMIYLNPKALVRYKADLDRWYDKVLSSR